MAEIDQALVVAVFIEIVLQLLQHPCDSQPQQILLGQSLIREARGNQLGPDAFAQREELCIANQRHLKDLGKASVQVTLGQGMQEGGVNQDCCGRVEAAQGILFALEIDGALDADGCVDLADEGSGQPN